MNQEDKMRRIEAAGRENLRFRLQNADGAARGCGARLCGQTKRLKEEDRADPR